MKLNYRLLSIPFILAAAIILLGGCELKTSFSAGSSEDSKLLSDQSNSPALFLSPKIASEAKDSISVSFPDGKKVTFNLLTNGSVSVFNALTLSNGNVVIVEAK